jgi:hypothetical protein
MPPRPVLILGHPGHELLIHDWMGEHGPLVLILTDGSGSSGRPRIAHSRRIVAAAGATPGPVFGAWSDAGAYAAILRRDVDVFAPIVDTAAEAIVGCQAPMVVSDAIEHFNPVHDLCAVIASLACAKVASDHGLNPGRWWLPIEQRLDYEHPPAGLTVRRLSAAAEERRRALTESIPELASEVGRRRREQPRADGFEVLAPIPRGHPVLPPPVGEPFYETFGRSRVADGVYRQLITFEDHMAPLAEALAARVLSSAPSPPRRARS